MKKVLFASFFALIMTFSALTVDNASAASNVPDGFYNLNTKQSDFVESSAFVFMTPQEKIKVLFGDYHLVVASYSYTMKDFLGAKTNAELDQSKITVEALQKRYNATISSDGKITPGVDESEFKVMSIE